MSMADSTAEYRVAQRMTGAFYVFWQYLSFRNTVEVNSCICACGWKIFKTYFSLQIIKFLFWLILREVGKQKSVAKDK